jgi:hypothetical protein
MDKLWQFIATMIKQLDVGELTRALTADGPASSLPQQLTFPRRVRPKLQSAISATAGSSNDELFWRLLSAARRDEADIAHLQDVVDVDSLMQPLRAQGSYSHMYA